LRIEGFGSLFESIAECFVAGFERGFEGNVRFGESEEVSADHCYAGLHWEGDVLPGVCVHGFQFHK
jgi:hypothetical protein